MLMAVASAPGAMSAAAESHVVSCHRLRVRTSWKAQVHSGSEAGALACANPLGGGRYRGRLRVVHNVREGEWSYLSRFTMTFAGGRLQGLLSVGQLNVFPAGGETQMYAGAIRVTRGTGAYRHVTGVGPVVCTTSDGGSHVRCNFKLKLTGL
jgi:hypothetical protein